jgi:general secretion pathway protein F
MPGYTYTACDSARRTFEGEVQAVSRQAAARQLAARGIRPLRLREQPTSPARGPTTPASPRPHARPLGTPRSAERLPFLKALNALVSSGYPVGESLRLLPRRLKDRRLQGLSVALWERLSAGATFSQALEDFPGVFDAQSVNLIRAGEATGNVREVLRRLIQHYTAVQQLRRRVLGALSYPVFICVVAVGVLVFFAVFLMPRLQGLLDSLGGSLPLATRMLLATSRGLITGGPVMAAVLGLAAIGLWRWRNTPEGRKKTDACILRLPLLGPLAVDVAVQGFCQTLAVLLENGVTTIEALRIAERTVANRVLGEGFRRAADAIVEGQSPARALAQVPRLPEALLDRFSLGESTGHLAPQLRELAAEMEESLTHRLRTLTDAMSTGVLLVSFAFVGFVAYAIVSAVFQVSASFKF